MSDKLQRSMLPGEVNRQRDLFKMLNEKKMEEDDKCHRLMHEIITKKRKGEDIELLYAELQQARKMRAVYAAEEAQEIHKQFAMEQNFIKMIDKSIDDIESGADGAQFFKAW